MKVLGFNFAKLAGHKSDSFSRPYSLSTNIDFLDITEQPTDLIKDSLMKVTFNFTVEYIKLTKDNKGKPSKDKKDLMGSVEIQGSILASAKSDEVKEIVKLWKKKEVSDVVKFPLFNMILRKCTPKAVEFESDLDLPIHVPVPQLRPQPKQSSK